jgi:hypothetical protein
MSPIVQQALDLAAWLFIWFVRLMGVGLALAIVSGIAAAILTK